MFNTIKKNAVYAIKADNEYLMSITTEQYHQFLKTFSEDQKQELSILINTPLGVNRKVQIPIVDITPTNNLK